MRRIFSLLLVAFLLAAGCTGGRSSPPALPPSPPASEGPTAVVDPPPVDGPKPGPPGGLKALIGKAPDGARRLPVVKLVGARGSTLLFAAAGQFWLADEGLQRFTAIDLRPAQIPLAEIAPDGKALLLMNGQRIYRVGLPAGEVKQVGTIAPPARRSRIGGEPGFDPNRHGAGLQALEQTCPSLRSAVATAQSFDDTAGWQARVTALKNELMARVMR